MADVGYVLTAQDRAKLVASLEAGAKRNQTTGKVDGRQPSGQASEVYVARVPCGQTIPPISLGTGPAGEDVPGFRKCCIFKMSLETDITSDSYVIEAIEYPDGSLYRETIYNIYTAAVDDSQYWRIQKSKGGRWLVEQPATTIATPTTTPAPTPTTVDPGGAPRASCDGECKWIWSAATCAWVLDTDECELLAPTTTSSGFTTTTIAPGFTTTTTACICPTTTAAPTTTSTTAAPTTTSSGHTTTSTTPAPTTTTTTTAAPTCECVHPTFCGTEDGDCAFTACSTNESSPPDCSGCSGGATTTSGGPTTTTTCDCSTTSTVPPGPGCTVGCEWFFSPVSRGWILVSSGCGPTCPCSSPPNPGEDCDSYVTPCRVPVPPTTPPPQCQGSCDYVWTGTEWVLTNNGCVGTATGCVCSAPTAPGNECGNVISSGCGWNTTTPTPPDPTTTTTAAPCASCYSTPPPEVTTTSTSSDCQHCAYAWDGSEWNLTEDLCTPCDCVEPGTDGHDTCEITETPCAERTTTTTPGTCCDSLQDVEAVSFAGLEWCTYIFPTTLDFHRINPGVNIWQYTDILDCGDFLQLTLQCTDPDPGTFQMTWNFPCASPSSGSCTMTGDCINGFTFTCVAANVCNCLCCCPTTTSSGPTTTAAPTTTTTAAPTTTTTAAPTTTTTAAPICNNYDCHYECQEFPYWEAWVLLSDACPTNCDCYTPPSGPCTYLQIGNTEDVPCDATTTTTTASCNTYNCAWECEDSIWNLLSNTCPSTCDCYTLPSGACGGPEEGNREDVPCDPATTTTTAAPTTTTTGPPGMCCMMDGGGSPGICWSSVTEAWCAANSTYTYIWDETGVCATDCIIT